MGVLYCGLSLDLNRRSLDEVDQLYLFKFGRTSGADFPAERFNLGWLEDDGSRSQPLALQTDWKKVRIWPLKPAARIEHTLLKKILTEIECPFMLRGRIRQEIYVIDSRGLSANDNGINDIRCLSLEKMPYIRERMRVEGINDPLSSDIITAVSDHISEIIYQGLLAADVIAT